MKLEREHVLGAATYERTPDRTGHANGVKDRTLRTLGRRGDEPRAADRHRHHARRTKNGGRRGHIAVGSGRALARVLRRFAAAQLAWRADDRQRRSCGSGRRATIAISRRAMAALSISPRATPARRCPAEFVAGRGQQRTAGDLRRRHAAGSRSPAGPHGRKVRESRAEVVSLARSERAGRPYRPRAAGRITPAIEETCRSV